MYLCFMKIVLLDAQTLGQVPNMEALEKMGSFTAYQTTAPEQVMERIADAEVVITNKVILSGEAIRNTPSLQLICVAATGTNNIDHEAAKERGIPVRNVAGYSTQSVAQHTFALLLGLLGQSGYHDRFVKDGAYAQSPIFTDLQRPYWELAGKTMGIIGLGNIGRAVARVAQAFGMKVVYFSTSGAHDDPDFERLDLHRLMATSDVVSIHAPLNDRTQDLIGIQELKLMQKHAILLNLGRGGIVVEQDLVQALNEGMLFGAGFDVFVEEPIPADHVFGQVQHPDRLLLSPHIAWASVEARETLVAGIIKNIQAFKAGH